MEHVPAVVEHRKKLWEKNEEYFRGWYGKDLHFFKALKLYFITGEETYHRVPGGTGFVTPLSDPTVESYIGPIHKIVYGQNRDRTQIWSHLNEFFNLVDNGGGIPWFIDVFILNCGDSFGLGGGEVAMVKDILPEHYVHEQCVAELSQPKSVPRYFLAPREVMDIVLRHLPDYLQKESKYGLHPVFGLLDYWLETLPYFDVPDQALATIDPLTEADADETSRLYVRIKSRKEWETKILDFMLRVRYFVDLKLLNNEESPFYRLREWLHSVFESKLNNAYLESLWRSTGQSVAHLQSFRYTADRYALFWHSADSQALADLDAALRTLGFVSQEIDWSKPEFVDCKDCIFKVAKEALGYLAKGESETKEGRKKARETAVHAEKICIDVTQGFRLSDRENINVRMTIAKIFPAAGFTIPSAFPQRFVTFEFIGDECTTISKSYLSDRAQELVLYLEKKYQILLAVETSLGESLGDEPEFSFRTGRREWCGSMQVVRDSGFAAAIPLS